MMTFYIVRDVEKTSLGMGSGTEMERQSAAHANSVSVLLNVRRIRMEKTEKIVACKGDGYGVPRCEYDSSWFCKNPDCKALVLTSTLIGARPSGCPKVDKWNSKAESN